MAPSALASPLFGLQACATDKTNSGRDTQAPCTAHPPCVRRYPSSSLRAPRSAGDLPDRSAQIEVLEMRAVGCECQAKRCFVPSVELDLEPLQILCQRRVGKVHAAKVVGRYDRQGLHVVWHIQLGAGSPRDWKIRMLDAS